MSTAHGQVNTKTAEFRELHFQTLDDALAEARRIAQADRGGTLRRTGNWTAGQVFGHLAAWVGYGFDGHSLKPPWFIKFILRMQKKKFLTRVTHRGVSIPGVEGGTLAREVFPTEEGLARLEAAYERLRAAAPTIPNVLFGHMTHDEWIRLHLRHAELHMGYLWPKD